VCIFQSSLKFHGSQDKSVKSISVGVFSTIVVYIQGFLHGDKVCHCMEARQLEAEQFDVGVGTMKFLRFLLVLLL
jgi:hypothetical protein